MRSLLKPLPRRANLSRYPVLRWFHQLARKAPFLWSFKRRHVLRAIYVGSVIAFMPFVGLQLLIVFAAVLLLRANLTVAAALQFITNPLTMAPIYYSTYRIGDWLIGATGVGDAGSALVTRINALIIGGAIAGLACAVLLHGAYFALMWESRRFKAHGQKLMQLLHLAPEPAAEPETGPAPDPQAPGGRSPSARLPSIDMPQAGERRLQD